MPDVTAIYEKYIYFVTFIWYFHRLLTTMVNTLHKKIIKSLKKIIKIPEKKTPKKNFQTKNQISEKNNKAFEKMVRIHKIKNQTFEKNIIFFRKK